MVEALASLIPVKEEKQRQCFFVEQLSLLKARSWLESPTNERVNKIKIFFYIVSLLWLNK